MSPKPHQSIQRISVIVPRNPFAPPKFKDRRHCLCALDVAKLMEWWPGTPHSPHRLANKVTAIQRALDWKRVASIAAYLLQREIIDVADRIDKYFSKIYEPRKHEPGRQWPPKVSKVVGYQRSEFPTFPNVLLHVNGATVEPLNQGTNATDATDGAAKLTFDEDSAGLDFSVIDGQHRINGAYFAICIRREHTPDAMWEIPAEVFLGLDEPQGPPRRQAQIFIDVNFYQKQVDKSLVADLFPTARGPRGALDRTERAQDIGRKLMLETGPLVGMIQIPGIKYGVKGVITLATLNSAVEDVLEVLERNEVTSLDMQTEFISQCLAAWLEASGRFESKGKDGAALSPQNVVYQGRILVSVIALTPGMLWKLRKGEVPIISDEALSILVKWLKEIAARAHLLENGIFISKNKFKERGYLGSGGIGRFRDSLWAVTVGKAELPRKPADIATRASLNKKTIFNSLS